MTTKLTKRERVLRAVIAAALALMFAGSAMTTLATAMELPVAWTGLYLAGTIAAALCVLGASSGGGAVLASLLFTGAAAVFAATHTTGLTALRALFASWNGEAGDAAQIALGGRTLLTGGAFVLGALFFALLNSREFVSTAVILLLTILVTSHAMSEDASLGTAAPGLIAAAAAFALTGGLQREPAALRALLPAALAVAVALALIPAGRMTWAPLEQAANRVRLIFEQYFHFTEQRVAFSISEQGYNHAGQIGDSVVSMLGGPATPHTDPVMEVRTDAQTLLRGAIRTAYTGYSWVDAEPKNRYLYVDITHRFIRDRVFSPGSELKRESLLGTDVSVEMLDEGTSTLFVPGLLERFDMDLSTAVYYNTAGEMFLSRTVQPGDSYSLRALVPAMGDALRNAVLRGEEAGDERYQDIAQVHTQLPEGIEGGVYTLTMQLVQDLDNPYDRAVAIMNYLRRNMRYTLDTEYPPQGRDFVSWFLLDAREGYCSYYATAMAVMGRMAGLPTRYVEGYMARPGDNVLTGENAHAWAEVYFKGVGWVPFDATGGTTGSGTEPPVDEGGQGAAGPNAPDGGQTPEPTGTPEPGFEGGVGDEPTPSPEPGGESAGIEPEPSEAPDSLPGGGEADGNPDAADRAWLWWALGLLMLLALAALAVLWARARLRRADPALLCKQARTTREAAMILYRANLTALAHMGQTPVNGEAPESFAARVSGQFRVPEYAAFVSAVDRLSYGNKPLEKKDLNDGLRAYAGFKAAMGRRERLRFALTRLRRGLGSFESIP